MNDIERILKKFNLSLKIIDTLYIKIHRGRNNFKYPPCYGFH